MKKVLTLIMAFVLVLSLSATAFAAEAPADPEVPVNGLDANVPHTFEFEKIYVDQKGTEIENGKQPVEKLQFTVKGNEVANAPQLSVTDATTEANPQKVTVTVAPAEKVTLGKYEYTITEAKGSTAGVTYGLNTMKVQVMIAKGTEGFVETITFRDFVSGQTGPKVTSIKNKFESNKPNDPDYGPLTIDKNVTGNMGDTEAWFAIDVILTSPKEVKNPITVNGETVAYTEWTQSTDGNYTYTATLKLQHGTSPIAITDVPVGTTYKVVEKSDHTNKVEGHDYSNEPDKGYDATYTNENGAIAKKDNVVVVTNTKGAEVDTGITLDVLPYVIILGIAVLSLVLFTVKRRVQE